MVRAAEIWRRGSRLDFVQRHVQSVHEHGERGGGKHTHACGLITESSAFCLILPQMHGGVAWGLGPHANVIFSRCSNVRNVALLVSHPGITGLHSNPKDMHTRVLNCGARRRSTAAWHGS